MSRFTLPSDLRKTTGDVFVHLTIKQMLFPTSSAHGVRWIWKLKVPTAEPDQPILSVLHPDAGSLQGERHPGLV